MPQVNPKVTNIAINPAGGALTLIVGTIIASKVEVMEDPAYNGGQSQGLQGYYMDPNSKGNPSRANPNLQTWLPNTSGAQGTAYQPIRFGGQDGRVVGGHGDYASADGVPLLQLTMLGVNAGGVILTEWP